MGMAARSRWEIRATANDPRVKRAESEQIVAAVAGYSCADGDNPLICSYCDIVLRSLRGLRVGGLECNARG